ncbi:uncharacterized protein YndB with AHSA1/START domain [Tahibacter aquaticus]|jgi:uncharacterized protein YndB with AHSA1/START domain|uniref:Uncharacterized protein YndB with AHSA1/START domain n=1 Tax=Tahibacter aquaticus TaxID=520092 RepID=A0A4R6YQ42_9GAMM|nr:SRPBCC family protein [Tahibacter aquaticus]TDR39999.1 uncharacterized protein YndB with AHSA1/START domain [Tahibacter aquaticus]
MKADTSSTAVEHSVAHAQFTLQRVYPVSPERVFRAWADPAAKNRWFVEGEGWEITEYSHDFRVGGRERGRFAQKQGDPVYTDETVYFNIVPQQRIVLGYSMARDGTPISASLLTVELRAEGDATRLILTEQGAFLDGHDATQTRELGWSELLSALGKEVARAG